MAKWTGVVTNKGAELLAAWAEGTTLNIYAAAAGTGTVAEAAMIAQTALAGQKQAASIVSHSKARQRRRQAARTVSEFRRHRRSVGIRFTGLRLYVLWPDHDIQHRQYLGHGRCKRRRYHSDYAGRYRRCYRGHSSDHHRHHPTHNIDRRRSRAAVHRQN